MSRKNNLTGKQSFEERQAAKKAAVLNAEKNKGKSRAAFILVPLCAVALVLAGVYLFRSGGAQRAVALANEVKHPVKLFEDGRARHFQLDTADGLSIRYFVLKSSDGIIRAAFDACDVCWPSGKGYYQEGDYMVCRNCGKKFASIKVNEIKGGCNPAPLNRQVVGDNLVIKAKDILDGEQYFNFSRKG
jgi:uncharacterized membrane protein